MVDRGHIERFEMVLDMLAGKRFAVPVTFFDGGNNAHLAPAPVFPDGAVVQSAGDDGIAPGSEDPFRRSIYMGISGRKIMGVQGFLSIGGKDDFHYHVGCPDFLEHACLLLFFVYSKSTYFS